jgi:hypothetical protein
VREEPHLSLARSSSREVRLVGLVPPPPRMQLRNKTLAAEWSIGRKRVSESSRTGGFGPVAFISRWGVDTLILF